jgi:hypothetical protein
MPADDSSQYDSIKHKCVFVVSNPFFILGLFLLSLPEANLIYKLWIKPKYPVDPLAAFGLQFVYLMPFLFISVFWYRIDKQMNKEGISPSFAEELNRGLLILLTVVYLLFSVFLNFVTR